MKEETAVKETPAPEKKTTAKGTKSEKKEVTPKGQGKKPAATTNASAFVQSMMGGNISVDEILGKIPEGATAVYVKPEENKAYWVKKDSAGDVELW